MLLSRIKGRCLCCFSFVIDLCLMYTQAERRDILNSRSVQAEQCGGGIKGTKSVELDHVAPCKHHLYATIRNALYQCTPCMPLFICSDSFRDLGGARAAARSLLKQISPDFCLLASSCYSAKPTMLFATGPSRKRWFNLPRV